MSTAQWKADNRDAMAAYQAKWQQDNREKCVEYAMRWKSKNPDWYSNYTKENPWVQRVYNSRRRAKKASAFLDPFLTSALLTAWASAGLDVDRCIYCDATSTCIDHIVPFAMGGKHVIENCVPCCRSCNSSKHDFPLELWVEICKRSIHPDALERIYAYRGSVLCAS